MIRFEHVHKTFSTKEGQVAAVTDLSFEVPEGEFFTLLGPSGCGKTTTLRMIAGLEVPDSGRVTIGNDVVFSSADRLVVPTHKRDISMVFQSYAIWPHMTVFNNVAYPLKVKKVARHEIAERVESVLDLVGLGGLGSRQATRLSGGQQQRVALARALVSDPKVLLLDEPLSNLDAQLRAQMRTELKALQSRIGVTTIYVTHDQQEALAMSDDICVMSAGQIAQRGSPDAVYHRPRNRFTAEFIGSTNLIVGQAEAPITQGLNQFQTSFGSLTGYSSEDLSADRDRVMLSVRPEVIGMAPSEPRDATVQENTLRGSLEQLVFLGESIDCEVRVGGEPMRVKGIPVRPIVVGTEVELHLPPEHCTVLVDEAQVPAQAEVVSSSGGDNDGVQELVGTGSDD